MHLGNADGLNCRGIRNHGEIQRKGYTDVTQFTNILHLAFLINFQLCSLHLSQKPVQL